MMLVNLTLFAAVFFRSTFGAIVRTSPVAPPCPRTIDGLQGQPHVKCTESSDWTGDGFNNENCRAAIQKLYNVEVAIHKQSEFEFLSPGAIPYTSNPVMKTPRRYSVGQS